MRRRILGLTSLVGGLALCLGLRAARADGFSVSDVRPARFAQFRAEVSVGVFNDTLSPYGDWIQVRNYGRVWRPHTAVVGVGFRPYATRGHWVYTDYGWSFESDYEWGWAPFHYGRWLMDPDYQWVWVPDTTWGPSWVDWRFGGGYVGWAPLPPMGAGIAIETYSPNWFFVEEPAFVNYNVYSYAVPRERVQYVFSVSAPVRNEVAYGGVRYHAGPPPARIAAAVGVPITPVRVSPPRAGVVQPIRAQVVSQPQVARQAAASPYHAIAAGHVQPSPQAAGRPAIMPPAGARPAPAPPLRAAPVPQARPAPAPQAQPVRRTPAPAQPVRPAPTPAPPQARPVPQQRTPAPLQERPAPQQRTPAPPQVRPAPQQHAPAPAERKQQVQP